MNEIRVNINDGKQRIAIYNQDDELLTVIKVDTSDSETAERFGRIIDNLNNIARDCENEAKRIEEEKGGTEISEDESPDIDKVLEVARIRVKYLKRIVAEIDGLFGEGTIAGVYGDVIPDEIAIMDFVEKVIPVMNSLYGKRYEMNRKRFNSKRRGMRK